MKRILFYLGILTTFYLGSIRASAQAPSISYSTATNVYTTGVAITTLTPDNTGGAVPATVYSTVTTYAGSGGTGRANSTLTASTFNSPRSTTIASGTMYCADAGNNEIRKILATGVTLFAGSASGSTGSANAAGTAASFNGPYSITNDGAGNLYVADLNNNCVRKIVIATATVSTIATGLNAPAGIVYDPVNNVL